MIRKPLFSIIVPVYKTPETYLRECIKSVLNQSIQDFELILIDDGSPDICGEICDEYAEADTRIIVIHQNNSGPSAARNAGLKIASGKYLTFLDSDDLLKEYAWETALYNFEKNSEIDCIVFGWEDITSEGTLPHSVTKEHKLLSATEAVIQIASDNFLCGGGYPWNKIWNADHIKAVYGEFINFSRDVYTYEDKLWIIETLEKLKVVCLIPDILYEYRFLPSSLTQSESAWLHRQFNAYDAYDLILDKLQDKNNIAYCKALKFYFYFCFTDLCNLRPNRKHELTRYKNTKKRLHKLSRRIKLGELPNLKYNLAWLYFLFLGWL